MSTAIGEKLADSKKTVHRARYPELAASLKRRIGTGEFVPGDRLPTFAQLSAEFGVAYNTLNNVVSLLEKEGVVERRRGSGIYVSHPRSRIPRTNLIGLVSSGVQQPYRAPVWVHLLNALRGAAMNEEKRIVLLETTSSLGWDQVEGVLIADWDNESTRALRPDHLPCVSLLFPMPQSASVMSDEVTAGRLATEHLLALGHKRIAFLHLDIDEISIRRAAGYHAALHAGGIEPSPQWERRYRNLPSAVLHSDNAHIDSNQYAMQEWLADGWKETGCTAILCQNDEAAFGVHMALTNAGWNVPGDVSLVGFEGLEAGERMTPPLTSVRTPVEQIASTGLEVLLRQLETGELAPLALTIAPKLMVRDSTISPRR